MLNLTPKEKEAFGILAQSTHGKILTEYLKRVEAHISDIRNITGEVTDSKIQGALIGARAIENIRAHFITPVDKKDSQEEWE